MSRHVYRYEIHVDDMARVLWLTSDPVYIASRTIGVVEIWAEFDSEEEPKEKKYLIVGTGHIIPDGAKYVGTTLARHGLVWHLYELDNNGQKEGTV